MNAAALIMSAVSVLLAVGLLELILLRTIDGPVRQLLARTQALGSGDRQALRPLTHYGTREIAALAQDIFAASRRLFDRSDYIATLAAHVSPRTEVAADFDPRRRGIATRR